MKQFLIIALLAITSLGANAQPPQRPLPNQFRDYVDHQQRWEKPNVEHKDGKVTITMSEEQFRRMQQIRMNHRPGVRPVVMNQHECCKKHKTPKRRRAPLYKF